MIRARKIVKKFHNYSYEILISPVIVNSYKNGHKSYQIVNPCLPNVEGGVWQESKS